jgi:MFS family permease
LRSTDGARFGLYGPTFLLMLGQGVVIPLLPSIVDSAPSAGGASSVGIAVAAFGLARLLASLPAGYVTGRVGPRLVIVAGPLLMAASLFGIAFAHALGLVVMWRLLAGVSSALFLTASMIYLSNAVSPARRGRAFAYFYMAFSAGISAGPAIGGLLADIHSIALPLVVVGATSLVSAVLAAIVLPGGGGGRTGPGGVAMNWAPWSDWRFLTVALLSLLVYATRNGTQQTVVPTAAVEAGMPLVLVGIGFTVAAVVNTAGAPLVGYLLDRFDRRRLMVMAIGLLGFSILGWTLDGWQPVTFIATMGVYGFVSALADSSTVTNASDLAPEEARARGIGYFRVFSDGGYVLGPLLFAGVADATSTNWAIVTNSVLLIAAAVLGLVLVRRMPRLARGTVDGRT